MCARASHTYPSCFRTSILPRPLAAFVFPSATTTFHLFPHTIHRVTPAFFFSSLSHLSPITHSSESRSFSSLFLSLKQPRECMLSSTSGSMSSAEGRLRMVTFLGTGCSGSGSFFPPLGIEWNDNRCKDIVSRFSPRN